MVKIDFRIKGSANTEIDGLAWLNILDDTLEIMQGAFDANSGLQYKNRLILLLIEM
jgi:hypothetical protein